MHMEMETGIQTTAKGADTTLLTAINISRNIDNHAQPTIKGAPPMATQLATTQRPSLAFEFGGKYGVEAAKVFTILKETVLKSKDPITDAEVAAFIIVCNQYDLNPFTKEIYGFMSKGKMQYVLGVDGWITLLNRQPNNNGIEFTEHFDGDGKFITSITCKIHRKDRALPTVVTEYFSECRRDTDPWKQSPIRMLRHKALIQCARIAFGLAGVMDEDEAERMDGFNGYAAPVLEAQVEGDEELDALMQKLQFNSTKRQMSYRAFGNRRDEHLSYLQAEIAKMSTPFMSTAKTKAAAKEKAGKPELVAEKKPEPQTEAVEGAQLFATEAKPADGQYFTAEDTSQEEAHPQPQQQEANPAAAKSKMNW
jgi:phage recombination protein Bet